MNNHLTLSRRDFVKAAGAVGLAAATTRSVSATALEQVTDIGTRREMFVENTLISKFTGGALDESSFSTKSLPGIGCSGKDSNSTSESLPGNESSSLGAESGCEPDTGLC